MRYFVRECTQIGAAYSTRQAPLPPSAPPRGLQTPGRGRPQVDPEDLYVRQHRIGKGSFGEVYKGYEKRTTLPVAIKIIDLEAAEDEIEDIQLEIQILGQMDSEWVTR